MTPIRPDQIRTLDQMLQFVLQEFGYAQQEIRILKDSQCTLLNRQDRAENKVKGVAAQVSDMATTVMPACSCETQIQALRRDVERLKGTHGF